LTEYAVKVFYMPQPDRQTRYQLINNYLKSIRMPRGLVSFAYDDQGISVKGQVYPTLVMDWADGVALDTYLNHRLTSGKGVDNRHECKEWVVTLRELQDVTIAHGDLQHKNILVRPGGGFRLVDYDGMFVPGMEQLSACEAGLGAYQHPDRARTEGSFNERMDDFSALVILLTLSCVDDELWGEYHKTGYLLVSEEDLRAPGESPLFGQLSGRPGPVGALAAIVKRAAEGRLDQVPSFASVIGEVGTEWVAARRRTSASRPGRAATGHGTSAVSSQGEDGGRRAPRSASPGQSQATPTQPLRPAGSVPASRPPVLAGDDDLTDRQRQIAELLAAGRSVGSIAATLGLRPAAVARRIAELEQKASGHGAESLPTFVARPAPVAESTAVQQSALTPRQQEVLGLLRGGMLPEQIADRFQVLPTTLTRHLATIRAVIGGDELDALLAQASAKERARREAARGAKKPAAMKTAGRQPVTGQPAKPAPEQTARARTDAPSPRTPVPTQQWWKMLEAPQTHPTAPTAPAPGPPPPAIPSRPQPARPLSKWPAAPSPSAGSPPPAIPSLPQPSRPLSKWPAAPPAPSPPVRRPASPKRFRLGTAAAVFVVALVVLVILLAVVAAAGH
jgi:DNA-binding NarL/FixJ family response regulator